MKNDFFPQTVATMFTMMMIALISLVSFSSCNDTFTFREGRGIDSLSKMFFLTAFDNDTLGSHNKRIEVHICEGKIDKTIVKNDSSQSEMTIYYHNSQDTIVAIHGDITNGILNVVPTESIIELGEKGWPKAYKSIVLCSGQYVTGNLAISRYPSGELQKLHVTRSDYQGIVNDCEADIEFFYEDDIDDSNSIPIQLCWARFHPELINSLTLCEGMGEYVATMACISGKKLKRIAVNYATEDPIFPGKIVIEYDGLNMSSTQQNPGRVVMGGSKGSWDVNFYSYFLW